MQNIAWVLSLMLMAAIAAVFLWVASGAARAYALELLSIARNAETPRPELAWARRYLGRK